MSRLNMEKIKRLERVQQKSAAADSILDAIGVGAIFADADGVITHLNRAAEEMFNVERAFVIGKKVYMLPLRTPLYRVLSENSRENQVEMAIDGRIFEVVIRSVADNQGCFLGEMTEVRDVTAQKKEKRQWEEFVAMITHDLKSPVTVINGYLQMMKMGVYGALSNRMADAVGQMELSGSKLITMIEDLLGSYRLEMGLTEIVKESCEIGSILEECYRENLNSVQEKHLNVDYYVAEGLPSFKGDNKQLARAFNNLIGNAIKFTPRGGALAISAAVCCGSIHVVVDDSGIGIPLQDQERIFNRYYRSPSATGFKGTGLGLAITRAIVEAHGGAIEVDSREGKGSRFTVLLPLEEY